MICLVVLPVAFAVDPSIIVLSSGWCARSGERRRGCGLTGVSLRAVRDGNKVRRASPGLCGNWDKFEGGARW